MTDEAQARKLKSHEILQTEGVPININLPVIETEEESIRRTTTEVAERAMALAVVAFKGEGLGNEKVQKLLKEFNLASVLTPKERTFINAVEPSQHDRIQFTWRYECYWVMLWALSFIEELWRPDKICDVRRAAGILIDLGNQGFLASAELRSQDELLDAADLIYRYHWAVVEARVKNQEVPAGLDSGVVLERHYALNWLIGYGDESWDDVTTDT